MGDRKEIVAFASETEILKGMLRLLNPGNNVVYFLTGHGERDIEQAGEASMTRAKTTLESKNYTVKTLNLLAENQIPEDASLIVIAGPLQPVSEEEVNLLKDYLANGGSLIVMEDPTALTEFGDAKRSAGRDACAGLGHYSQQRYCDRSQQSPADNGCGCLL